MHNTRNLIVLASLMALVAVEAVKMTGGMEEDIAGSNEDYNGGLMDFNGGKVDIEKTNTYKRLDSLLDFLESNLKSQISRVDSKIKNVHKSKTKRLNLQIVLFR